LLISATTKEIIRLLRDDYVGWQFGTYRASHCLERKAILTEHIVIWTANSFLFLKSDADSDVVWQPNIIEKIITWHYVKKARDKKSAYLLKSACTSASE